VARASAGDIEAFAQLVEDTRDTAVRVAARLVGPRDPEDVAQDAFAFLRAFHRLGALRDPAVFRP
jgi:DNA-directed RNA polymerase specialized sigma24 family protein